MTSVQPPVPLDATVGDVTVDDGLGLHRPAPAIAVEGRSLGGEIRVTHVNESGVGDAEPTPVAVPEEQMAGEHAASQIERDLVTPQTRVIGGEPVPRGPVVRQAPVAQTCPVGQVDHVLVADPFSRDLREEPVVATGRVGAGIVDLVGGRLGRGAPGGEPAVAECAQGFDRPLRLGLVAVEIPGERRVHG